MAYNEPKQTLDGIFADFLSDIKKSKNVIEYIGRLRETVLKFVKNEKDSIPEIAHALDQIDNQSGDLEMREKIRKLNQRLKDNDWRDWLDLTT